MDKFGGKSLCGGEAKRSETKPARGEYLPLSHEPLAPPPYLPSHQATPPGVESMILGKIGDPAYIEVKKKVFKGISTVCDSQQDSYSPTHPALVNASHIIQLARMIQLKLFVIR